jgi:hypothetical protein
LRPKYAYLLIVSQFYTRLGFRYEINFVSIEILELDVRDIKAGIYIFGA